MKNAWQRAEGRGQRVKIFYPMLLALCPMLVCLYPILLCYANDDLNRKFYKANSLYEQGNYDVAIKHYNSIIESGLESGNLYYNLGNCYFKKRELGKALLYYEKSRKRTPLDRDLESNYEYSSSLAAGGAVVFKESLPVRALNNLFRAFTVDGLTILLSVLYALVLVNILMSLLFKPFKKQTLILAIFIGLFFIAGFIALAGRIILLDREAIVIVEQADAKFEPFNDATTYFTLPEGSRIIVLDKRGDWRKVKRPDGRAGWVKAETLEII